MCTTLKLYDAQRIASLGVFGDGGRMQDCIERLAVTAHSQHSPACPLHSLLPSSQQLPSHNNQLASGLDLTQYVRDIRLAHSAVSLACLPAQTCSSISHGCPAEWDPICSRCMQHTYPAGQQHTTKQPGHMLACRHVLLNNSHRRCRTRHQLMRSSSPPHMQKLAQPGPMNSSPGGGRTTGSSRATSG